MKILILSHEYPPIGGGGANACRYLSREYVRAGHEATVVTAQYRDYPAEEIIEGVRIIRVKAKRAKADSSSFFEMLTYLISAYRFSSRLCKKEHFDICQVFFGIPSGPLGYKLKKKYGIPYVIRFGGGDVPGFQKRFEFMYKLLDPFIRTIWSNADARVANSEGLKEMALAYCDKYDFKVIHNGVDTQFFCPPRTEDKNNSSEDLNILFVSRLIERKGLQFVIPELNRIAAKTDKKVHLTVVGDGPYRKTLEQLCDENAVSDMVSFAGEKRDKDLLSYYRKADIFILPSSKEGMPNCVLEAMACGLPIIMTPCQGSDELIDGNGIRVPITQFADAIIKLGNDSSRIRQLGVESRKLIENKYGWGCMADNYIDVFIEINKKHKA